MKRLSTKNLMVAAALLGAGAAIYTRALDSTSIRSLAIVETAQAAPQKISDAVADAALSGIEEDEIDAKSLRDMFKQLTKLERQVLDIGDSPARATTPAPVQIVKPQSDKELKKLREALDSSQAEIALLQEQVEALRIEAQQKEEVIRQRELERAEAEKQVQVVESKQAAQTAETGVLTKMNAEWEAKHEELVSDLINTRRKVRALQAEISSQQTKDQEAADALAAASKQQAILKEQLVAIGLELKDKQQLQFDKIRLEKDLLESRQMVQGFQDEIERKRIVEQDNSYLREELDRQREKVVAFEQLQAERDKYSKDLTTSKNWVQNLSKENSKLESLTKTHKEDSKRAAGELKQAKAQIVQCSNTSGLKDKEIYSLRDELKTTKQGVAQCKADLSESKTIAAKVPALQKKLVQTQNQLLMKQAEAELDPEAEAEESAAAKNSGVPAADARARMEGTAPQDMKVVVVNVNRGKLRAGPGEQHSPVMEIAKGGRLSVESEEGNWYRVFTPRGTRAYIAKSIVRPWNPGSASANQKPAVKNARSEDADNTESTPGDETAAFESLRRGINSRR